MRSARFSAAVTLAVLILAALTVSRAPREPRSRTQSPGSSRGVSLTDVTAAAGIRFRHTNGSSGRLYLPEVMGSGCAFLDYDGDGWQDIFLVNSCALPGFRGKGPFFPALYRNRGYGMFEETTRQAGLTSQCYGMGCAVGDYDNDGDPDLYVTTLGGNHLFRNEGVPTGQARFVEAGEARFGASGSERQRRGPGPGRQAGVARGGFSTSAAWVDYDRDGDLDLFVCRYARWRPETNRICPGPKGPSLCRPSEYPGEPSILYQNLGDGRFRDVSDAAGIARGRGSRWAWRCGMTTATGGRTS
jgi:enediyne biosynthesis protein E4